MIALALLLTSLLIETPGPASWPAMLDVRSSVSKAARGFVVLRNSRCDYFVVETLLGYDLLEWYGGNDPARGDELVGSFEEYGFHDIYNITAGQELRVWVEDYWLSEDSAIEEFYDKCD